MNKELIDKSKEMWNSQSDQEKQILFELMMTRYKNIILYFMSDFADHMKEFDEIERSLDLTILFIDEWLYKNFKYMLD